MMTDGSPINESEIEWATLAKEDTKFRRKQLGEAGDSDQLGCSLYELPAGGKSWPYHYHTANEEAIYVLSGTGALRLDSETYPLREGDYATFPATESGGHRIVNDSEQKLRYLMFSTMIDPDVTVYPEMEKFGVFVGSPPGGREEHSLHGFYKLGNQVDYWPTE